MLRWSTVAFGGLLGLMGCSGSSPTPVPDPEPRPVEQPEPVHPLLVAMQELADTCEIDVDEATSFCPKLNGAITHDPLKNAGKDAVPILVDALASSDPKLVVIASNELQNLLVVSGEDLTLADPKAVKALLELFPTLSVPLQRKVVAFAAEAGFQPYEAETRSLLEAAEDPLIRARGWSAVLRFTRLDGLQPMMDLADGTPDERVSYAVLRGIDAMNALSSEEQALVCPWAVTQLDRSPNGESRTPLFSYAAQLVEDCPDGGTEFLLRHTEAYAQGGPLEFEHALVWKRDCDPALRELLERVTPAQCDRIRVLLEATAKDARASEKARATALDGLAISFPDDRTRALLDALSEELPKATEKARRRFDD